MLPRTAYKKGQSGNPNGRPKGSYTIYKKLEEAITLVEKERNIDVFKHFVKRALDSDVVLIALLRKLVPDRQQVEGDVARVINIINGYRSSNQFPNGSLRQETGRESTLTESNSTKSS